MSDAERGKMMALFTELGITDRAERLRVSSEIVGTDLASANDLTKLQRHKLIAELEERHVAMAERKNEEPPEDNFGGSNG